MGRSLHTDRHHGISRLVGPRPDRPGIAAAVSGFLFDDRASIVSFDRRSRGSAATSSATTTCRSPAATCTSDFCAGELRTIELFPGGSRDDRSVGLQVPTPSSFGEDSAGRIYVASLAGPVFRLIAGVGPVEAVPLPVGVFASPVYVTSEPDDPDRLFVVEQDGTTQLVVGVGPPTTFLDIPGDVGSSGL